jgi:carboxypeptidase family protein
MQARRTIPLIASIITMILLLSLIPRTLVRAQTGTSDVTGTVVDPQGKVVAGATVTIKDAARSVERTQQTNDAGGFTFNSIAIGTYTIEVEASGFKKAVSSNVQALVAKTTTVTIRLEVGVLSEQVTVSAGSVESLINASDASIGNNFNSFQIENLPLNARNVGNLLTLQPGVTIDGYVAGGRRDQANLTLDGVDVNEQQQGSTFDPVVRVNPDTVEEFRVTTLNPNATQGRSSGAQIQLVTKSGTNALHGNLYEYHRNTITTANDFFNNQAGLPKPALIRNLFGGSIGGPIKKDRFFYFFNYEGLREAKQGTRVRTVPLPSLGRGEVKFFDTNDNLVTLTPAQINALTSGGQAVVDENPIALATLASAAAKYPANDFSTGDTLNTAGFRFNAPLPVKLNAFTLRLDYKLKSNDTQNLFFRANYQADTSRDAPQFPDTPAPRTWSHPTALAAGHTWLLTNKLVNSFKYGLSRVAFSRQGDSTDNAISFRDVFSPRLFDRTLNRTTPTHNFTDDVSWLKGKHNFEFGTNVRIIRNSRESLDTSFDNASLNGFFYAGSGNSVTNPIIAAGFPIRGDFLDAVKFAMTGVFGRLSEYSANANFGIDGQPLPVGQGNKRTFATEEYEWYAQDTWKLSLDFTLTLGLRYSLSRPVYETHGFQTTPNIPLSDYFQQRIDAAAKGQNFDQALSIDLAGPANNKPNTYPWDKNNFQPRLSFAWSPSFSSGILGKIFGNNQTTVIRGGFAMTNDFFGEQLAVSFDANNTLGFVSSSQIAANTFNVTNRPAPLYTGPGMSLHNLPQISLPATLQFPQQQPQDGNRRIEASLDSKLESPVNYTFSLSWGRKFGAGILAEVSYIGRIARHLLVARDVMQPNNIVDPKSGMDWYTAAGMVEALRRGRTPIKNIPNIAYFDNLYGKGNLDPIFFGAGLSNTQVIYALNATGDTPGCGDIGGCFELGNDWTTTQDALDSFTGKPLFFQSQYGALSSFHTSGKSDFHGLTLSLRQRFKGLTWDLNYTYSKSIDDASGLQTSGLFAAAFILNALRPQDSRAVSDFDVRHILNVNSIWEVPVGTGKRFLSHAPGWVDAILGGWQLSNIFRFHSGEQVGSVGGGNGWPTNWQLQSSSIRTAVVESSPTKKGTPNLFTDVLAAFKSFRSPGPGETGDRNILRYPSYIVLDAGLSKSFKMPYNENHRLVFRWETFNITNTQRLTGIADLNTGLDPFASGNLPGPSFGNFTAIQGAPRIMQFALRYEF